MQWVPGHTAMAELPNSKHNLIGKTQLIVQIVIPNYKNPTQIVNGPQIPNPIIKGTQPKYPITRIIPSNTHHHNQLPKSLFIRNG